MNKILRQIANTIVANLGNTEPIGLFDGKIGISLFLYKYARYSGCEAYEDIASCLIDDVFKKLKPDMSPSAIDGLASIGYGLSTLLKEGFLESDPDDDVLHDMDKALLRDIRTPLMKEMAFPIPLHSSGIYLLYRMSFQKEQIKDKWIAEVIESIRIVVTKGINNDKCVFALSLLNSILYICRRLTKVTETYIDTINYLIKDILCISVRALQQKKYKEFDILLFKQNIAGLSLKSEEEHVQLADMLNLIDCFSEKSRLDVWYDNLWWSILYDQSLVEDISLEEVKCYLDNKIQEAYFDEMIVNSKLAAAGLWLMKQK